MLDAFETLLPFKWRDQEYPVSDVVVSLAGTELARVAVPSATGPLGFCLEGCTADFRRLKFR